MFVFVAMGPGSTVYRCSWVSFLSFFLIKKTFKLCTAIDKDYAMFVLQCCYGSAYGFIWWKFAEKSKEVLRMNDKQKREASENRLSPPPPPPTNIGIEKALDCALPSGPTGVMGATSPAWALRQEAGDRSQSQGCNQYAAGCLTFAFQSLKQGAIALLCAAIAERKQYNMP
uniref:Uncharacterized protein n=1 Tax=Pipistrellus kuhlii TaxID=59472 RepID=A0A7J8A7Z7_PIPKU|nr:hypothetical protein mPipKuh1_008979 [Pipistrellus kuhlii]